MLLRATENFVAGNMRQAGRYLSTPAVDNLGVILVFSKLQYAAE